MSEELQRIEQLEREIRKLKGLNIDGIPTMKKKFSTLGYTSKRINDI